MASEHNQDLRFPYTQWRVQYVGWEVPTRLIAAGLFGKFGSRLLSHIVHSAAATTLVHDRILQQGKLFGLKLKYIPGHTIVPLKNQENTILLNIGFLTIVLFRFVLLVEAAGIFFIGTN